MFPSTISGLKNSFGSLLREIRKQAGLSQRQFADYVAISKSKVSKLETGRSAPPQDPQFYDMLRAVPGFSDSDITLLWEAHEVDESASALLADFAQKLIEEKAKAHQKIAEAIGISLKIRAAETKRRNRGRSSIEVRRQGFLGKQNVQDLARVDAAKANLDRAKLTAQHAADLGAFATSSQKYVLDVVEHMTTIDDELPSELKPFGQMLTEVSTKILTGAYAETLMMLSGLGLEEITLATAQPTQAAPTTGEEEAQAPSPESFTDTDDSGIIPPPMPPKEVEPVDHLTEHISELQTQAKLGSETKQRPIPYPHENVVFHVAQLQAENLRKPRAKKRGEKPYEVVGTLRQAAAKTGVPEDEIVTTRDIEAEHHINKKLVQEYTQRGRRGRPHLTPLDVRLAGAGGGQLLFRRGDIERLVANPPKPGRTRK
jgi:transcriptional regulator with XRE-family HTH domain